MPNNKYLTVTALNQYIKRKYDQDPYLKQNVFLTGEISNFRRRPTHQYFSLKDEHSTINAVMFKGAFAKVKFNLENGIKVLVCGHVSTYPASGQYQIYIDRIEPDGVGALYQALEQLKQKLAQEGLFNQDHKLPLPKYPKRIAVITSPSGAVIKDIIKTVRLRYRIAQIVLFPTVVQGDKAASDIVRQIHRVEAAGNFDTLIVGRGGGSIEDLWPFNDEAVARAIYDCPIPTISSVGHQTDFTIADSVADVRAATPTAAAEFAVPELSQVTAQISDDQNKIIHYYTHLIQLNRQQLNRLVHSYIFNDPARLYENYVQRVDIANDHLKNAFRHLLNQSDNQYQRMVSLLRTVTPMTLIQSQQNHLTLLDHQFTSSISTMMRIKKDQYQQLNHSLEHLSPKEIMKRGYSYVTKDGHILKSVEGLKPADTITLNLSDGQVDVKVSQIRKENPNGK